MKNIKSCPKLCKSSYAPHSMKRSVSADALPQVYELYQSFTVSKASLQSIPCMVNTMASYDDNKMLEIGACLATPPDVKCQEDDAETIVQIQPQRRKQDNDAE
jgi:hypothetical protein